MPDHKFDPDRPPLAHYLALPAYGDEAAARAGLPQLEAWLDTWSPAAVLVTIDSDDPVVIGDAITVLQPAIQSRDIALLLAGDPVVAKALDCDGVHLPGGAKAARAAIGPDMILGIECGSSRHEAITAAEQGADYVCFGPFEGEDDKETVGWWQMMMEPPCVADGASDAEQAKALYEAGADFVLIHPN
ncbi:MAG: thiamine phosphate synthase [Alphaproteobacteria bacterium]|nr:thiamine phosphate synthase [Alphaproteobacteria bacterium SS10]